MSLLDLLTSQPVSLSVSELTAQIRELLEVEFFDLWVEGEVSNFKRHSSGHWYFTLKDRESQIRCAAFRNHNLYIRFRPEDGLKVRVRGRISVYDQRGEYQLLVNTIEPIGRGALQLAFEQLKEQLLAEGLFDEERKRPLPRLPRSIGVVTSPKGAVIHDILQVLLRRNRTVNVLLYPVRVQGDEAAREIAEAINYLNTCEDVDVLIVGRGGGSIEDLWSFNEESVARAIFASRVPVISAVGHETDFTIADLVADCRAPTPSAAAEMVAVHIDELSAYLNGCREALASTFHYNLLKKREQAALSFMRLAKQDLKSQILANRNQLQILESRMRMVISSHLEQDTIRLSTGAGKLHALSPLAVLARGYALVLDGRGQLVKNPADVAPGDKVRVKLAEGEMTCIKDLE
jgi:exodeoxyribonuclease VII large subunit